VGPDDDPDALVRAFGSFALAASIDQPGVRFFGDRTGALAYVERRIGGRRSRIVLGDPLAPRTSWDDLVGHFLLASDSVTFLNAGEALSRVLVRNSLYANNIGWEAVLELDGYDLGGSKKQNIRNAVRRCSAAGHDVVEVRLDGPEPDEDKTWAALAAISRDWLRRRGGNRPENRLVTRPFGRANRYQRIFAMVDAAGRPVHFVTLDEMWSDGRVIGYHSNINRGLEDAPKNSDYALHAAIIEVLQAEQVELLSLGLCPSFEATTLGRSANVFMSLALKSAMRRGRSVYNLEGITAHKAAYGLTRRDPVYVCTQNPWPAVDVFGVFRESRYI